MNSKKDKFEQLQRFYALWKEGNAMYEDWAKKHGLSSNGVLVLYSLYEAKDNCTQKSISQNWSIPKLSSPMYSPLQALAIFSNVIFFIFMFNSYFFL